jgi:hypothetical protein
MTSRIFVDELVSILTNNLSSNVPVFSYDGNAVETLPCLLVGVESEDVIEGALLDNFLLKPFISINTNGYDDVGNNIAESIKNDVVRVLVEGHEISCLDGLFYLGANRQDFEESTHIIMKFDAYTHDNF